MSPINLVNEQAINLTESLRKVTSRACLVDCLPEDTKIELPEDMSKI